MGKRESGYPDWLSGSGWDLCLLGAAFLAGGAMGGALVGRAAGDGVQELNLYLTDYLTVSGLGMADAALWSVLWRQLWPLAAVVLLGRTAVGVVGIPVLFCVRGFGFAGCVACFWKVFGPVGLLPALALFGLPALLWCPALFWGGLRGMVGARRLAGMTREERSGTPLLTPGDGLQAGLCGILFLACAGVEYWVAPVLLRVAARIVLS